MTLYTYIDFILSHSKYTQSAAVYKLYLNLRGILLLLLLFVIIYYIISFTLLSSSSSYCYVILHSV